MMRSQLPSSAADVTKHVIAFGMSDCNFSIQLAGFEEHMCHTFAAMVQCNDFWGFTCSDFWILRNVAKSTHIFVSAKFDRTIEEDVQLGTIFA
jgi:hypothetical protein